jgi:hypothetical protein
LPTAVDGIPVRHLPWSTVQATVAAAQGTSQGTERIWLTELDVYLLRQEKRKLKLPPDQGRCVGMVLAIWSEC